MGKVRLIKWLSKIKFSTPIGCHLSNNLYGTSIKREKKFDVAAASLMSQQTV